ncbi:hypothetical protein EV561_107297 [Rhizobium sp. BK376]|nr:hypothetical protein EV561_107297 [Rhizobium sp. BK376]
MSTKAPKLFKMPHSTALYFAQSAYRVFHMRGNVGPFVNKTVHLDDDGAPRKITATVKPQSGVVQVTWLDSPGSMATKNFKIAKAWAGL